ncbi:MAG: hypothetical protein IT343_19330 [Candidatus Melainabacteria bacterium]|jgi:hypothetical protein|nr:hypothetical protein [Candidatus Melainabacteria bacterium]
MWLATIILVLAAIMAFFAFKRLEEDKAVLRHTIRVNLSILRGELDELSGIAQTQEKTKDVNQAQALLVLARALGDESERDLDSSSEKMLGRKLSLAFSAMDMSMRARHLLKAVRPVERNA